jgi:CMP-N-acetylneuraminic acid synthetase
LYKKKKVFGIITARKNSKGVKNKNIYKIKNKPLIEFTLAEAKKSKFLTKLILTTDDERIIKLANKFALDKIIKRKRSLSTSKSSSIDVIIDVLKKIKKTKPDYIMLLQPTSPLRKSNDIDNAIRSIVNNKKFHSLVSVTKIENRDIYKSHKIKNNFLIPLFPSKVHFPRQKLESLYKSNGSIYISKTETFLKKKTFFHKTLPYIMSAKSSLDIDTIKDIKILKKIKNL